MTDTDRRSFAKAAMLGASAIASAPLLAQAQTGQPGPAAQAPRQAPQQAPQQQPQQQPPQRPAPRGGSAKPLAPPDKQPPDLKLPQVHKKTGFAVVGLGQLALEEVMPAFGQSKMARPVALVSGHADKARQVAQAYGINPQALYDYANFGRIRDNAEIEVVYIILPNTLHAEFTIKALEAGKHVLCEKPMSTSSAECQRMIAAARAANRKLMIAYRLHYEPYNMRVAQMCQQKALGKIKTVSATNAQTTKAPNIRLTTALGGGPISDTGIYCINAGRMVTGEEPVAVSAIAHQPADNPDFREVPESVVWTMRYPSGVLAHCDTSFGSAETRRLHVQSADGVIELDNAFSYHGQRLTVKRGNAGEGDMHADEVVLEAVDQFAAEMDHFAECVQQNKPPRTPGELGLADLRIMEAVWRAQGSGRSEAV